MAPQPETSRSLSSVIGLGVFLRVLQGIWYLHVNEICDWSGRQKKDNQRAKDRKGGGDGRREEERRKEERERERGWDGQESGRERRSTGWETHYVASRYHQVDDLVNLVACYGKKRPVSGKYMPWRTWLKDKSTKKGHESSIMLN